MVELLMVIAIIALLAALLLPVLRNAKEYALGPVCRSNLRQIGVALHAYSGDYNGILPGVPCYGAWGNFYHVTAGGTTFSVNSQNGWAVLLRVTGYLRRQAVLCETAGAGGLVAPFATQASVLNCPRTWQGWNSLGFGQVKLLVAEGWYNQPVASTYTAPWVSGAVGINFWQGERLAKFGRSGYPLLLDGGVGVVVYGWGHPSYPGLYQSWSNNAFFQERDAITSAGLVWSAIPGYESFNYGFWHGTLQRRMPRARCHILRLDSAVTGLAHSEVRHWQTGASPAPQPFFTNTKIEQQP